MVMVTVPEPGSKAHLYEVGKTLIADGVDAIQVYRSYSAGDPLAGEAPSQVGLLRSDTVLYLDSEGRPWTAVLSPHTKRWVSTAGWLA